MKAAGRASVRVVGGLCVVAILLGLMGMQSASAAHHYLIVAAEGFVPSAPLTTLSAARTAQGFEVTTYAVPTGTSNEAIRSYIQSWYTPEDECYVLLVGDSDGSATSAATMIPPCSGTSGYPAVTDYPYSCVNDGDWFPDLYVGRFAVSSVSELQAIVDKTLIVESGTYSDTAYAMRALMVATNDTLAGAEATHDWVIDNYLTPGGFATTRVYAAEGGTTADVTVAQNQGCLFTTYIGHSGFSGWWNPSFYSADVEALTNSGLYGVVFSGSCGAADFTWGYGECFGEVWTETPNKGAAAFLCATSILPPGEWEAVHRLEKDFFKAFFDDDIWRVGPAWNAALYGLLNDPAYGPTHQDTQDFLEIYLLLGDPALRLPGGEEDHTGDLNCDGAVDAGDILHFAQALVDVDGYAADHDGSPYAPCEQAYADVSGDGVVDGDDVRGFVQLLLQ